MKIAAAYIRVSTDDQIEYSPDSQIKMISEYAKRNDYILPQEFIFIDEGISGRTAKKRPAFMNMIGIAKQHPKPFDAIIVWKFSRFARNREDSIVYKSMLKKQCGIDVISVSEQLSDDKTSILIEALLEAMDEYYSINLGEEVKRGMTEKATRGEPLSIPPFGYTMKDKELIIEPNEAELIKLIFTEFANGKGYRELATQINEMGIKTHRGNKFETRTVEYIINNPVYIGKIRWNPTERTRRNYKHEDLIISQGKHEAIISEELWNNVQKRIAEIKNQYRKYDKPFTFSNLLQGLVRCSNCGATLIKSGRSLQCQQYTKGRCTVSHAILVPTLEKSVIEKIESDFKTDELNVIQKSRVSDNAGKLIQSQIKKEEAKLQRIKEAYESGVDTLEEYKNNKMRINEAIAKLKAKIPVEQTQKELTKTLKELKGKDIPKLKDPNIDIEEKNKILRSFVDKIIFEKSTKSLFFYYYI